MSPDKLRKDLQPPSDESAGTDSSRNPAPSPEGEVILGAKEEKYTRTTIMILLAGVFVALFPIFSPFLVPIVLAATFAGLFYRTYQGIRDHLWRNRVAGSLLTCLLIILCILVPIYIVIQLVVRQMISLYGSVEPWVRDFLNTWQENPILRFLLESRIGRWIMQEVDWPALAGNIAQNATAVISTVINRTYAGIFGLAVDIVITLFVLFYFFLDGEKLLWRLEYLIPMRPQYKKMLLTRFLLISKATVKGTLIIGVVDGILGGITLLVFGVPGWALWGFLMIFLSILPLVGPGTVLVPAALIQVLVGRLWQGIGIFLVYLIVISNVDNVLRPRVVGSSARMHDLVIFFATLGGLSYFGLTGFIIGPVIASLFLTVLDIYGEEFGTHLARLSNKKKVGT